MQDKRNHFVLSQIWHYNENIFPLPFGLVSTCQYLLLKPSAEHKIKFNICAKLLCINASWENSSESQCPVWSKSEVVFNFLSSHLEEEYSQFYTSHQATAITFPNQSFCDLLVRDAVYHHSHKTLGT